jgi:hypothetical protein
MMILGGVVLVVVRWSIFASREVPAGAKSQSNPLSGQRINLNSIERWVTTELSYLTSLFSKSREAQRSRLRFAKQQVHDNSSALNKWRWRVWQV